MLLATVPPCLWWGTPSLGEAVMVDIRFDLFSSSHLPTRPHTPTHPHTHTYTHAQRPWWLTLHFDLLSHTHIYRGHDGCHSALISLFTHTHTHTHTHTDYDVTLIWPLYLITHTHTHTHTHTQRPWWLSLYFDPFISSHTHTHTHTPNLLGFL